MTEGCQNKCNQGVSSPRHLLSAWSLRTRPELWRGASTGKGAQAGQPKQCATREVHDTHPLIKTICRQMIGHRLSQRTKMHVPQNSSLVDRPRHSNVKEIWYLCDGRLHDTRESFPKVRKGHLEIYARPWSEWFRHMRAGQVQNHLLDLIRLNSEIRTLASRKLLEETCDNQGMRQPAVEDPFSSQSRKPPKSASLFSCIHEATMTISVKDCPTEIGQPKLGPPVERLE